jgi:hypothetical protein
MEQAEQEVTKSIYGNFTIKKIIFSKSWQNIIYELRPYEFAHLTTLTQVASNIKYICLGHFWQEKKVWELFLTETE